MARKNSRKNYPSSISVPNFCWHKGHKYECGLSLSCVFAGNKALDLCNGGMIWSCCVPRDQVDGSGSSGSSGAGSGGGSGSGVAHYDGDETAVSPHHHGSSYYDGAISQNASRFPDLDSFWHVSG